MVYRTYRRAMRKFARFILGFGNCPAGYRKSHGEAVVKMLGAMLLCIATIALFGVLVINC